MYVSESGELLYEFRNLAVKENYTNAEIEEFIADDKYNGVIGNKRVRINACLKTT